MRWSWSSGLALTWLFFSGTAAATQPLDSFIERAQTHSFAAREAAATERQRVAEAGASLGRLLPSFSARGVYTRNQDEVAAQFPTIPPRRLVITPLNQLDAFLQLDVPIIDLASYHRYKASTKLAEATTELRGAAALDVSRNVARAYYQFQGASALVHSAEQSIQAAQANLKNVEDRRSAGAATDLDHARAAASVARAEQELADAELAVALSARSLETLSGLTPAPADGFADDDLRTEGTLSGWLALAGNTPATRAAQRADQAAQYLQKASDRSLLPTLSGVAQERITNATGFSGQNASYILQLVLAWRMDYAVLKNRDAQSANLEVQRITLERATRLAEDNAFEAFRRVEAGLAKSRSARVQVSAAQRAADLSLDRYGAGVATQLDVTQAQRDAFLANAAKIQADADLAFARASLRLAAGVPVSDRRPR